MSIKIIYTTTSVRSNKRGMLNDYDVKACKKFYSYYSGVLHIRYRVLVWAELMIYSNLLDVQWLCKKSHQVQTKQ